MKMETLTIFCIGNLNLILRTLRDHLTHAPRNAKYMSPMIQNELIKLIGLEIRDSILKDVRAAKWYSIMADESTDSATVEQMSLCIRFFDDTLNEPLIREEFISFVPLENASAESITDAILKKLSECNLDVKNLRGQGYDGASVMSGKVSGVSSRIMQVQPRATYHHCQVHNLNLVISSSCKQVPEICDSIAALTWFLGASPKRKAIL